MNHVIAIAWIALVLWILAGQGCGPHREDPRWHDVPGEG